MPPPTLYRDQADIFNAQFILTVDEMRILLIAIDLYDPNDPKSIEITPRTWMDAYGANNYNARNQVRRAIGILAGSNVCMPTSKGEPKVFIPWVTEWERFKGALDEKCVTLSLNSELKDYFIYIKSILKNIDIKFLYEINSSIGMRIYMWTKQMSPNNQRMTITLDISWLRQHFGIIDKYPGWTDFQRFAISDSLNRINKASDLNITCKIKRDKDQIPTQIVFVSNKRTTPQPKTVRKKNTRGISASSILGNASFR